MAINLEVSLIDKVTAPAKNASNAFGAAAGQANILMKAMQSVESQATKAAALGDVARIQSLSKQYAALGAQVGLLEHDFPGATTAIADQARASAAAKNALKQQEEQQRRNAIAAKVDAESSDQLASAFANVEIMAVKATAAIAAVGAGLVVAGAALAIKASDFKNDTTDAFTALTGSAKVGQDTLNVIRDLERDVPDTEATLVDRAKNLLGQGLDPKQLEGTLRAMSDVATAIGEEGAQKVQNIVEKTITSGKFQLSAKQLVGTGVTTEELAKQLGMSPAQLTAAMKSGAVGADKGLAALNAVIENRLGGIAAKQVGDFDVQIAKFKDTFTKLFEDVDASPFLDAMHDLLDVFDQANPSGQALKAGITGLVNGLFSVASKVLPYIKTGFLHLIILGLQLYIALKPHLDTIKTGLLYVGIAVGVVVGGFALLVAGALALAVAIAAVPFALVALGVAIVDFVAGAASQLEAWVESGADLAKNFIDGLVDGVTNGISRAVDSVKNLGSSMLGGVKDVLGIHSPSREMMKLGIHTATGFAQGVTAANDNVLAAGASMASSATSGAASGVAPSGGGGITVQIAPGAIVIQGAGSPESTQQLLESSIVTIFERIALQQGVSDAA